MRVVDHASLRPVTGADVTLSIEGRTITIGLTDEAGMVALRLPRPSRLEEIRIVVSKSDYTPIDTLVLSDDLVVLIRLETPKTISVWPIVTWRSGNDRLDILLEDEVIGTTEYTQAVKPGEHTFLWRKADGTIVCSHTATLEDNIERIYICHSQTGEVEVEQN